MVFEYDFCDGWEYEVRLSSVNEYADGEKQEIVFIGGKRLSSEEQERLKWVGLSKRFNPEVLDLNACKRVAKIFNGK